MKVRELVAFDFDHTIVHDNTDVVVLKMLDSETEKNLVQYRKEYKIEWTDFMNMVFDQLFLKGFNKSDIAARLSTMELSEGMKELLEKLKAFKADLDVVIVSDSNLFFIETILKQKNLAELFDAIYTNSSKFDSEEKLKIMPFHDHACTTCPKNMCKSKILQEFKEKKLKLGIEYKTIYYVGDGFNDFCPLKMLSSEDFGFVRCGYSLEKLLNIEGNKSQIKGKIHTWKSATEIAEKVPERQIVVGICAMAKKTNSKPMQEILTRLDLFQYISICMFPESTILNKPVTEWPECDCMISFHSTGFPLEKAREYASLYKPVLINDIERQFDIKDRRTVYKILKENGIETPRYCICNRSNGNEEANFEEFEDHIVVGNETFHKPFVEKPIDAEDHNINIYFPSSAGGGCQKLFRKIGNRSSQYFTESNVRRNGSYIYEDFMPTDGTDVKVYTVGADYAHAEARKAPALDGKVERDREGKEVRFPVILSATEKLIARQVSLAFKQTVCGFDFLRANGKSYVCDVNGFSFVKNSKKYYDDCAKVLGNLIMRELAPQYDIPWSVPTDAEYIPIVPTTSGSMMELRTVVAVIRHGDRTPKQKMKMEVRHPKFFELFDKYGGSKTGRLKLKRPKQLQEVLDVARFLLSDPDNHINEKQHKVEQLKMVLEMYGHFSGINRKVQFKYVGKKKKKAPVVNSSSEENNDKSGVSEQDEGASLLLILKWGGELTPAGRIQAEELGRAFRCMYPGGHGDYAGYPGCGLLRLHSTYRHDLKIYASDEGRVQMTAAAFAKGLLALEGELTPILVQMVKSANMNGLLDNESDNLSEGQQNLLHRDGEVNDLIGKMQTSVKQRLQEILNRDEKIVEDKFKEYSPLKKKSIVEALKFLESPKQSCNKVHELITQLNIHLKDLLEKDEYKGIKLYHRESLDIMIKRWTKLEKDFKMKNDDFDISKIPDIYDCIKYDLQHNLDLVKKFFDIYTISKSLADVVIPQEYGFFKQEKLEIALGFCNPLLKKIRTDLQRNVNEEDTYRLNPRYSHGVLSPGRHVRTRLYFTSESHIHSLLAVLQHGGLCDVKKDEQWARAMDYLDACSELNYMSQIVIMLYEDPKQEAHSEKRFHIELHFSPGAKGVHSEESFPQGSGYRPSSQPPSRAHSPIQDVLDSIDHKNFSQGTNNVKKKISKKQVQIPEFQCDNTPAKVKDRVSFKMDSENVEAKTNENPSTSKAQNLQKTAPSSERNASRKSSSASFRLAEDVTSLHEDDVMSHQEDESLTSLSNDEEDCSKYSEAVRRFLETSKLHKSAPPQTPTRRSTVDLTPYDCTEKSRKPVKRNSSSSNLRKIKLRPNDDVFFESSIKKQYQKGGLGSKSSLFSNRVLAGASYSVPNLSEVRETKPNEDTTNNDEGKDCEARSIRPLETLHNSLSLKQMNEFLNKIFNVLKDPGYCSSSQLSEGNLNNFSAPVADQATSFNTFVPMKIRPNKYNDTNH